MTTAITKKQTPEKEDSAHWSDTELRTTVVRLSDLKFNEEYQNLVKPLPASRHSEEQIEKARLERKLLRLTRNLMIFENTTASQTPEEEAAPQ